MTMNQIDFRAWSSVALLALSLTYAGCSSDPAGPSPAALSTTKSASPKSEVTGPVTPVAIGSGSKPEAVLSALGKPAAVLLISGERNGYMEPCGCSEDQEGGLIRLYDLVERLHKRNWPTALVDLGSLIKDPASARGGFEQAKFKFDYAIKAVKLLNYNALALSAEDLKVGVGEALGFFDNSLGETTKIVAANVQPDAVFQRVFQPSLIVAAGPVKLGVTAAIDPELLQNLTDPGKNQFLPKIQGPDQVLPGILSGLEAKSDIQVLMVQGTPELAHRLARAFPGFDVVVATSQADDVFNREAEMLNDGKTMLVTVGRKGKNVGLVGVYPDASPRLRFLLVTLNKQFDAPATPMKSLIQDEFRGMLKAMEVVATFPRHNSVNGATFVGAETCKKCHPNTYEFWSRTGHAKAFKSLLNDPKPNTIFDADCITCHTTGFGYNSGWHSQAATPQLAGNQCENCHGPGSKHVDAPDDANIRKQITLKAEQAKTSGFCERCHDIENSRHFDFAKYWDKIAHNELDDYHDRKVHEPFHPKPPAAKPAEKPH